MSNPEPQPAPRDVLELDQPEQLKALGHPLRLKVLQVLGQTERPLTNRELAARLAVDPGHLHFHVRMLHRAGLIELSEAAGREKPYRAVARPRSCATSSAGSSRTRRPATSAARRSTAGSTSKRCVACSTSSSRR
jgi:DNA-binding transcriptional ArsR family regulator